METLVMPTILVILLVTLRYVVKNAPAPKNTPEQRRGNW